MTYEVTLRDIAVKDFEALDGDVQRQAVNQLKKLQRSPELGADLGRKMGVDLRGYRAVHFYKNQYRIVYKINTNQQEVEVWGVAKREAGDVYRMVSKRLEKEH